MTARCQRAHTGACRPTDLIAGAPEARRHPWVADVGVLARGGVVHQRCPVEERAAEFGLDEGRDVPAARHDVQEDLEAPGADQRTRIEALRPPEDAQPPSALKPFVGSFKPTDWRNRHDAKMERDTKARSHGQPVGAGCTITLGPDSDSP